MGLRVAKRGAATADTSSTTRREAIWMPQGAWYIGNGIWGSTEKARGRVNTRGWTRCSRMREVRPRAAIEEGEKPHCVSRVARCDPRLRTSVPEAQGLLLHYLWPPSIIVQHCVFCIPRQSRDDPTNRHMTTVYLF